MSQCEIARRLQTNTNRIRDLERGRKRFYLFEAIVYANCIQASATDLYRRARAAMEDKG